MSQLLLLLMEEVLLSILKQLGIALATHAHLSNSFALWGFPEAEAVDDFLQERFVVETLILHAARVVNRVGHPVNK